MKTDQTTLLSDHVDARPVVTETAAGRNDIVQLDPDHPGFRDEQYRARRNQIAQLAMNYQSGDPIPDAPYTDDEHRGWQTIWRALRLGASAARLRAIPRSITANALCRRTHSAVARSQ
jgi:hypothetical protein